MSRIIMPRGIIKPDGLVLDLPMQGEQPSGLELVIDGQDMGDAAWTDYPVPPVTNEQVASHDGQLLCRHVVCDATDQGVRSTLMTTVANLRYQLDEKIKVISGTVKIGYSKGGGTGIGPRNGITYSAWTSVRDNILDDEGGASARIFYLSDGGPAEFYVDEASFQELYTPDVSGLGNDGTVNGPTVAQGLHGGCYSFDGSDDRIDLGDPVGLQMTGSMTLMGWMNHDSPADSTLQRVIIGKGAGTGNRGYDLYYTKNAQSTLVFRVASDLNTLITHAVNINGIDGAWHHLAGVYNASAQTMRVYIDALEVGTTKTAGVPSSQFSNNSTNAFIGYSSVANNYLDGFLDKPKIFNRALTEAQIQYEMYRSAILKPVMNGGVLWP